MLEINQQDAVFLLYGGEPNGISGTASGGYLQEEMN